MITPIEALHHKHPDIAWHNAQVAAFEAIIDSNIRTKGTSYGITVPLEGATRNMVLDLVLRYRAAGWKVNGGFGMRETFVETPTNYSGWFCEGHPYISLCINLEDWK